MGNRYRRRAFRALLSMLLAAASFGLGQDKEDQLQADSAAALYASGRFAEARDLLELRIARNEAAGSTFFWLGYTYLALRERDHAIPHFERYLREDPANEDVLYALAKTYAELSQMSLERIFSLAPGSARAFQMRGIRFELEESWRDAIREFERAARLDGSMGGLYATIGRIYSEELHDETRALAAYRKELARSPHSGAANTFLERYYTSHNQPAEAARIRKNRDSAPKPAGDRGMGIALLERRQPDDSLPYLLRWRKAEPDNPDPYYYLGEAFTDLKVKTIQRLKAANPNSYRLHQILADNYVSIHKKADAIAEYRKTLEIQPAVSGVRYELARLVADTQLEEAIPLLKRELEMDPAHYLASTLLGRLYVILRRPDEALPLLETALRQRPGLMEAQKALGQAWMGKQDFARALSPLQAVAASEPEDDQIHFLLAQAWRGLGKPEEAAKEMQLHQQILRQLAESGRDSGDTKVSSPAP